MTLFKVMWRMIKRKKIKIKGVVNHIHSNQEVKMKQQNILLRDYLSFFKHREGLLNRIIEGEITFKNILIPFFLLNGFSFVYGFFMGSHHSVLQALATGIKIPILFSLSLFICFPAFFIIQSVLGSRLNLFQMVMIVLTGFLLITSIMLSFIPIAIFFQLTGGNYYFLILLHLTILALSAFFGLKVIINALQFSCEKKNIYPKTGVVVFRFWIIILVFVGIQLAWNLRPFMGKKGESFQLFREYEGNFYTAIVYSIEQLFGDKDQTSEQAVPIHDRISADDLLDPYLDPQGDM